MEVLFPQFMAVVLAVFLSPALPEDMIKVGDPCEQAMAVAHEQGLRLVDQEFVPLGQTILERAELIAPGTRTIGTFSLSYGQTGFARALSAVRPKNADAGGLLCSIMMEEEPGGPEKLE